MISITSRSAPADRSLLSRNRRAPLSRMRRSNMLLSGGGAETLQDRGSRVSVSQNTLNPYFQANALARWQEYVRMYMTSWEARKIIDIPVDDALRKPVEPEGLKPDERKLLLDAYRDFGLDRRIRRALIQERLLGGAFVMPVFLRPEGEEPGQTLDFATIQQGDLQAINVIDISRLSRASFDDDPFSPGYDRLENLLVSGVDVHHSRGWVLDGKALFGHASQQILEPRRVNPCGFGESKLTTLYDLINRAVGTQQGAFHLVNMASCLLVEADNLRSVIAADSPAFRKLQEITEQLSLYRGAVIDGKGVRVSQHSATFGSVPELVMVFAQLLSAASDIPATRYLGQAPGGLNSTGEGDQTNYYDMVEAYVRLSVMPLQRRCFDWLGAHLWGGVEWRNKSRNFELHYPSLKTVTAREEAEIANIYGMLVKSLCDSGFISPEAALRELLERKVFKTEVEARGFVAKQAEPEGENPLGEAGEKPERS